MDDTSTPPQQQQMHPPPKTPTTAGLSRPGSPAKLRLQSPQKLRERLQTEKRAADEAGVALRVELSRIAADMARVSSSSSSTAVTPTASTPHTANTTLLLELQARLSTLESSLPLLLSETQSRQETLLHAAETAVRAAEAKVRGIDRLWRDAMAENDELYRRFNGELGKIVRALKKKQPSSGSGGGGGGGEGEELVVKMKEQGEELARAKRENARLRRELVSLRAVVRAAGAGEGVGGERGREGREGSAETGTGTELGSFVQEDEGEQQQQQMDEEQAEEEDGQKVGGGGGGGVVEGEGEGEGESMMASPGAT